MAELVVESGHLTVRLTPLEKIGALHGDVRVPFYAVRSISVIQDPWSELRGIRAPGTGFPGAIMLGTCRGKFGKDFNAVYGKRAAVLVELLGHEFQRLLICTPAPDRDAATVRSMVAPAAES